MRKKITPEKGIDARLSIIENDVGHLKNLLENHTKADKDNFEKLENSVEEIKDNLHTMHVDFSVFHSEIKQTIITASVCLSGIIAIIELILKYLH